MSRQTFELLILGSSSASPTSERNPTAQLLNIAEPHKFNYAGLKQNSRLLTIFLFRTCMAITSLACQVF